MNAKNKKIFVAIALFAIVGGLILPLHQAHAGFATGLYNLITGRSIIGFLVSLLSELISGLIRILSYVPDQIYQIWTFVRDFVNLFYILILIIMAFGTIFDIHKYTFKELFVPFLISAVMINFSYPIGKYILDVSNGLSNTAITTLQQGLGGDVFGWFSSKGLRKGAASAGTTSADWEKVRAGVSCATSVFSSSAAFAGCARIMTDLLLSIFMMLLILFTYAWIALFLLFRMPFIWMYLIISPIAWLGFTLPNLRKLWNTWWEHFLGWCFSVPAYFGILMLLAILLKAREQNALNVNDPSNVEVLFKYFGVNDWLFFFMTVIFMVGGLYASFKIGKSFKGAAGWAAGIAQGAIKNIPLPGTGYVDRDGIRRRASISDYEKGVGQVIKRIEHEGIPSGPKSPLRGISWLWRGEGVAKTGAGSVADSLGKYIGFEGNTEGQKAELALINHDVELLVEEYKKGNESVKEIADHIKTAVEKLNTTQDPKASGFVTGTGNLDPHMFSQMKFLAQKGALTPEMIKALVQVASVKNPAVIEDIVKTAADAGTFKNSTLYDAAALQDLVAPIKTFADGKENPYFAPLSSKGGKSLQKQLFQYLITDDGMKKAGDLMNAENMNKAMELYEGTSTGEGRGFLREIAKVRPDLAANWSAENSARVREREVAKSKGLTGAEAEAFRFDEANGYKSDTREKLLKVNRKNEYLGIFQGDTGSEVASMHKNAYADPLFAEALQEHLLKMQQIDFNNVIEINDESGFNEEAIDEIIKKMVSAADDAARKAARDTVTKGLSKSAISKMVKDLVDPAIDSATKEAIKEIFSKFIGNAGIEGNRVNLGNGMRFMDQYRAALVGLKNIPEKEAAIKKAFTEFDKVKSSIDRFAQVVEDERRLRVDSERKKRKDAEKKSAPPTEPFEGTGRPVL